jgi:hypothetical protein
LTLTIKVSPEVESRLREEAAKRGQDTSDYVSTLLSEVLGPVSGASAQPDPVHLMTLPLEERRRILTAAAEEAAPLYSADLALPPEQRELTAFTALDGDEFYDYGAS